MRYLLMCEGSNEEKLMELLRYGERVVIYRIGDKQSDKLKIPSSVKHIVKMGN